MSAARRWILLKLAALAGAIVVYLQGAMEVAAGLLGVAAVLFLAAWWMARPRPMDDAGLYRAARDAVLALPSETRLVKQPGDLWIRAGAHLRTAAARMEHADEGDAQALQDLVAGLLHRTFGDPKSRKRVNYAVVDAALDACDVVAEFADAARGPVALALEERLWVELPDASLADRIATLRRGIPADGPLRSKGFDGPVFKRWVRDGVS